MARSGRRYRWMAVGSVAALALGATVVIAMAQGGEGTRSAPHPAASGSTVRTLVVAPLGSQTMSEPSGPLSASLLDGTIPTHPMMARVLSDANCTPDMMGVSHCTNMLRLQDGSELTVRHNHRMMDTPCLSPGERVMLVGATEA